MEASSKYVKIIFFELFKTAKKIIKQLYKKNWQEIVDFQLQSVKNFRKSRTIFFGDSNSQAGRSFLRFARRVSREASVAESTIPRVAESIARLARAANSS